MTRIATWHSCHLEKNNSGNLFGKNNITMLNYHHLIRENSLNDSCFIYFCP